MIALSGLCFFFNVGWLGVLGFLVSGSNESDAWILESTVIGMTFVTVVFLLPLIGVGALWMLNHMVVSSELQHRQIAWLVQKIAHDHKYGEET